MGRLTNKQSNPPPLRKTTKERPPENSAPIAVPAAKIASGAETFATPLLLGGPVISAVDSSQCADHH
jgi:hypothetical protein